MCPMIRTTLLRGGEGMRVQYKGENAKRIWFFHNLLVLRTFGNYCTSVTPLALKIINDLLEFLSFFNNLQQATVLIK